MADAIVQPDAVVVKLMNASIAPSAVFSAFSHIRVTIVAVKIC